MGPLGGLLVAQLAQADVTSRTSQQTLDLTSAAGVCSWTMASTPGAANDTEPALNISALVPGDLTDDLVTAGVLADPWRAPADPTANISWAWRRRWTWRCEFATPAAASDDVGCWLRFGAVDYNSTVVLNGVALGRHTGAMEPFEYDVTPSLRPSFDTNVLEVTVEPMLEAPGASIGGGGTSQCWLNDNAPFWKARTWKGWDFVPELWTAGIARGVELTITTCGVHAKALAVVPRVAADLGSARLELSLQLSDPISKSSHAHAKKVKWTITPPSSTQLSSESTVVIQDVGPGARSISANVTVSLGANELWWPVGYGLQPLWTIKAEV